MLSSNGSVIVVALREPVQINANVTSRVALSQLQLTTPQGATLSSVGAELTSAPMAAC